ncbi:methyl-accepting chemotaxis protein [Caldalkalibacillus uzonensis]|uniref:histidine kinase n=1 Tax=Caldalkalibacillus uzonensis TaxID=353224 RepID=A0ABU0CN56_9BACI|nr:methyl-accepting chemotaxis protein [Caldalkalibacillus uzonensis]
MIVVTVLLDRFILTKVENDYFIRSERELLHIDYALTSYFKSIHEDVTMLATHPAILTADDSITSYMEFEGEEEYIEMTPSQNGGIETEIFHVFRHYAESHHHAAYVYMGTEHGGYIQYPEMLTLAGYDPRERPFYQSAVENPGETVMTGAYPYSEGSSTVIVSSVRSIEDNGQLIGVVGVDVSLEGLTDMIGEVTIGENGYVILVEDNGTILAHPRNPEANFNPISSLELPNLEELRQTAFYSAEINDQPYILHTYVSPELDWHYIAVIDRNEILQSAFQVRKVLLITGVIFVAFIGLTAFLLSSRVTKRLNRISALTISMAQGDLSQKAEISGEDEIGQMASNFNKMANGLKEMISHISKEAPWTPFFQWDGPLCPQWHRLQLSPVQLPGASH